MPPANQKPPPVRKRTRKRKRRVASSSESSSDSDSSANASPPKAAVKAQPIQPVEFSSDSDDSDSSSSSSSASSRPASPAGQPATPAHKERVLRPRSPSPEPIPVPIPTFLSGPDGARDSMKETEMRERFRKLWMESVADAFQSDLQELQKVRTPSSFLEKVSYVGSWLSGAKYDQVSSWNSDRFLGRWRRGVYLSVNLGQ